MEPELGELDIRLLQTLAAHGELGFPSIGDQRRLDRLELEGYVESVRNDSPRLNAPPSWIYRLTHKGTVAAERDVLQARSHE